MNAEVKTNAVAQLTARVEALEKALEELKSSKSQRSEKEMTDDHAYQVTYGDMKDLKHKDAAEKLGLTYGQIYSCRLEFTFKGVHKKAKGEGQKNGWVK